MILYHMSDTLKLGDEMALDFKKTMNLAQPFVQALEQSQDCFYAMAPQRIIRMLPDQVCVYSSVIPLST